MEGGRERGEERERKQEGGGGCGRVGGGFVSSGEEWAGRRRRGDLRRGTGAERALGQKVGGRQRVRSYD